MREHSDSTDNSTNSGEHVGDDAPKHDRWNYFIFVSQGIVASSSKAVGSVKLLLPYLYTATGAPVFLAGMLMPIVSASRLIAQLVAAPIVSRAKTRKWFLFAGWMMNALGLCAAALSADVNSNWLIMTVFVMAALAIGVSKGVNALAINDLISRNIEKKRRNSGVFFVSAASGLVTICVVSLSHVLSRGEAVSTHNTNLAFSAAFIAGMAGFMILLFRETIASPESVATEQAPDEAKSELLEETKRGLRQLRLSLEYTWMRRYLLMRVLTTTVIIAMPFYAVHGATVHADKNAIGLSAYVIATSISVIIFGPIWKWLGARSQRATTACGSALTGCAGLWAIAIDVTPELQTVLAHSVVFAMAAAGIQAVNGSRMLFLIEASPKKDLTFYVAITNTVSAVTGLVLASIFGLIAEIQGVIWPVVLIVALNFLAALHAISLTMPENDSAETGDKSST